MQVQQIIEETYELIQQTEIGEKVTDLLLPGGTPWSFENDLWDYKRKLPFLPEKPDADARASYNLEISELFKDIVSFHNSYGGYLIFGVEDSGKDRISGCDEELDVDDMIRRLKSHTGAEINIFQKQVDLGFQKILLVLVPKRRALNAPVTFIKGAPENNRGKQAYAKSSIYVRKANECRPATNTHEDWKFLHSDRKISKDQAIQPRDVVLSNIPPRDPDMINFVGREEELCALRAWILDRRNPIKLISGIGGLGKTSVAYHFCEELATTGAGGFEYIAWVSAKKSTFAALRGELVKTARHDFSTVDELLQKLIIILAGESSLEDHMDQDDYMDVLTDALLYRPSFIVVDDLDSLAPDQQKECATILLQISSRTVDRENTSSKILLTSRLDQTLSPTAVIKISGLEFEAFDQHVKNLCNQFGFDTFKVSLVKEIYKTSSGSPLFASAIVRLASLGENPKDVCNTWSSKDGEDVREFAFKRELDRLTISGASVLLAVVNLGEVAIDELLEAVEISKRNLLDRIAELQAFHLLTKNENRQGNLVFSASKELLASANILRSNLGSKATEVERKCAIIRKNQRDQTRSIGIEINKILKHLDERENNEALIVAKDLSNRNPKNGDVWCVLARAYLTVRPPKYAKADAAVTKAIEFSCSRPELFDYVVLAKQGVEDWIGLKRFTESKRSTSSTYDKALSAYIVATSRLLDLAAERGNNTDAANYAVDGITRISDKILNNRLEPELFQTLMRDQNRLAGDAVRFQKKAVERPRDNLFVSDLGFKLINLNVLTKEVVCAICEGLTTWSISVGRSSIIDDAEIDIAKNNVRKLDRLLSYLPRCKRNIEHESQMVETVKNQLVSIAATR